MRRIFLFMNASLDGYFEGPGHDISFFNSDDDHFEPFSAEAGQEVDTILLGHRTYNLMKSFWPTAMAQESAPEVARFMNEKLKLVASHQPFDPGWRNVQVIYGDVVGAVKQLKEQYGKTIIMFGSNQLCVSLMQAGLVDEFQVVVNPLVLGAGTRLFEGLEQPARLHLRDTHTFKSGKVLMRYVA